MSQSASLAAGALVSLLKSTMGVERKLAERLGADPNLMEQYPPPAIHTAHLAGDAWEKTQTARYPQLVVYCERIRNQQSTKFRRFSGTVDLVIEVRHSADHIPGLEQAALLYVESVTDVIEGCRGEWRSCVYSSGAYEVKFEPVKAGGKRFLQVARITVPVNVNLD